MQTHDSTVAPERSISTATRRNALKGALALSVAPLATAAAAAEMAGLFDAIEKHRTAYALFCSLTPFSDKIDERFDPSREEEFETANDGERAALQRVIDHKTDTLAGLKAKARYLAEVDNMGSLDYEHAYAFIHAIANT